MFSLSCIYKYYFLLFYIQYFSFSQTIEIFVDEKGSDLSIPCQGQGDKQNPFHSLSSFFLCLNQFMNIKEIIIFLRNDEYLVFNLSFSHQLALQIIGLQILSIQIKLIITFRVLSILLRNPPYRLIGYSSTILQYPQQQSLIFPHPHRSTCLLIWSL